MKKLSLIILVISVLAACGPKTVQQSKKVMKGYWTLDKITYSETGTFNVMMFDDTSKECLEGSSWRFIPNVNTGLYSVNNEECPTGNRNFIFTVREMDKEGGLYDFLLKPTDAKNKSTDSKGFRLRLSQLDDTQMQWQQTVNLDGKPFKINMNFFKTEQ